LLADHQADGREPLVVRGPQVENRCCTRTAENCCCTQRPWML